MSISLQGNKTRRLTYDGILTAAAMMLSYLEVLIPFEVLIPLPGFKPGFANLVTVAAFVLLSFGDALIISLLRISLTSLLFGTVTGFLFSLGGTLLTLAVLLLASKFLQKCSYWGVCLLSATAHNVGQLTVACLLFRTPTLLFYLPFLSVAALISGSLTGLLLNLSMNRLENLTS